MRSSGMSLIELLVVMGIIGLLVGLIASAFRPNSELAVSGAAAQVSNAIAGARQLAISKNCRTRFYIVTGSDSNPEDWRLHRYGVLKVKDDTADTTDTTEFVPATRMEELASGVYFRKNTHEDGETVTGGESMFDTTENASLQGSKTGEYAYIEFLPTGGTSKGSTSNIFEIERAPTAKDSIAKNKNYVRIGVAQYTGRVTFERPQLK